jgi:hypothetical protein
MHGLIKAREINSSLVPDNETDKVHKFFDRKCIYYSAFPASFGSSWPSSGKPFKILEQFLYIAGKDVTCMRGRIINVLVI